MPNVAAIPHWRHCARSRPPARGRCFITWAEHHTGRDQNQCWRGATQEGGKDGPRKKDRRGPPSSSEASRATSATQRSMTDGEPYQGRPGFDPSPASDCKGTGLKGWREQMERSEVPSRGIAADVLCARSAAAPWSHSQGWREGLWHSGLFRNIWPALRSGRRESLPGGEPLHCVRTTDQNKKCRCSFSISLTPPCSNCCGAPPLGPLSVHPPRRSSLENEPGRRGNEGCFVGSAPDGSTAPRGLW